MNAISKIKNIHDKMEDPLVSEWVLDRLSDGRTPTVHSDELEKVLFNDMTILRLIQVNDSNLLVRLFSELSPERFQNAAPKMADQWPLWNDAVAGRAALVIARCAPDTAERLFSSYLESPSLDCYSLRMVGALSAFMVEPKERWRPLFVKALELIRRSDSHNPFRRQLMPMLLGLAAAHGLPDLRDLLADLLTWPEEGEDFEELIFDAFLILAESSFFEHVTDLRSRATEQSFRSLAILFRDGAPLDRTDGIVRLRAKERLPKAEEFLRDVCKTDSSRLPSDVLSALELCRRKIMHNNRGVAANFLLAVAAESWLGESIDWSGLSLDELLDSASLQLAVIPGFTEMLAKIAKYPKEDVISGLQKRLSMANHAYAGSNLANTMGALAWPEFIPCLLDSLNEDAATPLCEAAQEALTRFGQLSETAIVGRWNEMDESQKVYSMRALRCVGAEATSELLARAFPEMRNDFLEEWCHTALGVPDVKLIRVLEPELKRNHTAINCAFSCLCALLDYKHPMLDPIRQKERERWSRSERMSESASLEDQFDRTLRLELRCESCGDICEYDVESILIDPTDKKGYPVIGDEFACLSCGQFSAFEFTEKSMFQVIAESMKLAMALENELDLETPIQLVAPVKVKGKTLGLAETLDHYREAVERNPDSSVDLLRLGDWYKKMKRREKAEEFFRKCLRTEPTCVEASVMLAEMLADADDFREALDVLTESLKHKHNWRFYRIEMKQKDFLKFFGDLHDSLLDVLGIPDSPDLGNNLGSPDATAAGKHVSRNDPCPCGSGKKYKKCCLSRIP
jgi:hypothetical protein